MLDDKIEKDTFFKEYRLLESNTEFYSRVLQGLLKKRTANESRPEFIHKKHEELRTKIHKMVRNYTPVNASKSSVDQTLIKPMSLTEDTERLSQVTQIRNFRLSLLKQLHGLVKKRREALKKNQGSVKFSAVKSYLRKKFDNNKKLVLFEHQNLKRKSIEKPPSKGQSRTIAAFNERPFTNVISKTK